MAGWIKDYRKEVESDIWLMPPMYHRIWQYLKYMANHTSNEIPMQDGTTFKIMPGQHLTSIRGIAKGVGWWEGLKQKEPNPKTVKKILDFMVVNQMIKINSGKGNRQYTLVTIENWDTYQEKNVEGNSKVTVRTTAKQQSADINKNDKECLKNDKKKNIYAEFVQMTEIEYQKLVDQYGELNTKRMIQSLDNYKGANGKKYKSDYRAILNWVVDKVIQKSKEVKVVEADNGDQKRNFGF